METAVTKVFTLNPKTLQGLRLLIVDDGDADVLVMLLKDMLQFCGAEVTTASTTLQGRAVLENQKLDCLVSNVNMSGGKSYTMLKEWRQRELAIQQSHLPAIVVSTEVGQLNQQKAQESGFDCHISKPFDPDHFVEVVRSLSMPLRNSETTRQTLVEA